MKLSILGELEILKRVVFPHLAILNKDFNNDCAIIPQSDDTSLLWTVDPCPKPVAALLGIEDPEILGWLTVVINYSDIAACGGKPLGVLVSVEMPDDTELEFFDRFNNGIQAACKNFGGFLLGGNLKQENRFSATGTALGIVDGEPLARKGIVSGDEIFVVGDSGVFWAAALSKFYSIKVSESLGQKFEKALLRPTPHLKAGQLIQNMSIRVSCMDSSDGILNCCHQFAATNLQDVLISENPYNISSELKEIYSALQIDYQTACYGFGDWQLVCAVSSESAMRFQLMLGDNEIPFTYIGKTANGTGKVRSMSSGKIVNPNLINENFSTSYNSITHFEEVIDTFLREPLFVEEEISASQEMAQF